MLVAGNGFVIDAPANATVILRNLEIQGLGKQGLSGMKMMNAAAVYLENVLIT